MKIVTISGKTTLGKDSVANILKENLETRGYSVLITHYTDYLKFICRNYFGWNGEKNEEGISLLHTVETQGRNQDPNFWVDKLVEIINLFDGEWDYVIIPDARYENEVKLLKNYLFDVFCVRVNRPDYESSLNNLEFDLVLNNTNSNDSLRKLVEATINY